MLVVRGLTKRFYHHGRAKTLFEDLSFDLPRGGRLAVIGRNGQGKSTFIKILGGVLAPTAGAAQWFMTSSWPIGFAGGVQGGMTGHDNINFLARIYQRDPEVLAERVDRFADLGEALTWPVKHYSSGMRARLTFGLSLAIEFDCYLIDELIAVGDVQFRDKCHRELFDRRAERAYVMASHDTEFLRRTCNQAIIFEGGRAKFFDDVNEAVDVYASIWDEIHGLGDN